MMMVKEWKGGLNYYTKDGHIEYAPEKGMAVAHTPGTVHAAQLWTGDRYIFDLKSDPEADESDCMLKELLD